MGGLFVSFYDIPIYNLPCSLHMLENDACKRTHLCQILIYIIFLKKTRHSIISRPYRSNVYCNFVLETSSTDVLVYFSSIVAEALKLIELLWNLFQVPTWTKQQKLIFSCIYKYIWKKTRVKEPDQLTVNLK